MIQLKALYIEKSQKGLVRKLNQIPKPKFDEFINFYNELCGLFNNEDGDYDFWNDIRKHLYNNQVSEYTFEKPCPKGNERHRLYHTAIDNINRIIQEGQNDTIADILRIKKRLIAIEEATK